MARLATTHEDVNDIDFLPAHYYQKHVQRRAQPWRIVVVAVFVALLAGAAGSQYHQRNQTKKELAAVTPQYDLAVTQTTQLSEVQAQLEQDRVSAELFTYLRHPWPRTQLLAAVLAPLPEEITLEDLQISREAARNAPGPERRSRAERAAKEEQLAKLSPAARDLKRLRDKFDKMETLLRISGITDHSALLHSYLGTLGNSGLFSKAELDSIESVDLGSGGTLQFHATLTVRPCYGQPNGPAGRAGSASLAHHRETQ